MNILLITYQGQLAGSTHSISFLAKGLAARGHRVVVGLKRKSILYDLLQDDPNVILIPMTFGGRFDRSNIKHIASVVKEFDIQIINAQSSRDRYTTIFAKWFYGLNVKIYHTRRQPPKSIGGPQNWFYRAGTEKFIVVSDELKNIFVKKGFPPKHLHVIHNGIPGSRFQQWSEPQVFKIESELGISKDDFVIGCVSRIKRQQQLLQAFVELNLENGKLVFVGIEKSDLDTSIIPEHMESKVLFPGKVDSKLVLNYYKVFDIDVLPSVTDGFGLVLVEAMAMDCPVIATNFGGIKSVVNNRENGLLFEDGDIAELKKLILEVKDQPKLREILVEGGRKTAFDTFNIETTISGYEDFFESELKAEH